MVTKSVLVIFCSITCVMRYTLAGLMNHFAKLITFIRHLLDIFMIMNKILCALMQDLLTFTTYVMVL